MCIVQYYTLICCPGRWCLSAYLKLLLGAFDGVWWTPGLGATPVRWLRLRWHQYGWSCIPARVVDGELPPALHGVVELALAPPRLVGAPAAWCCATTGEAGRGTG